MIDFYQQRITLDSLKETLAISKDAMSIPLLVEEIAKLKKAEEDPCFWQDVAKAQAATKHKSSLEKKISTVDQVTQELVHLEELIDFVEELDEESEVAAINQQLAALSVKLEKLSVACLLKGDYDTNNAILALHAGAGGTEAQDWVEMLYRMYTRYAERNGYTVTELDILPGDEAGIKSVTFSLIGDNAYGFLKAEKGVHRLVRISPFDSNKRRHTSFASLEVMPEIIDTSSIVINPDELRIDTYRSSGAGGQHVNKTDSAIRITHIPTNTVVSCQNQRSQIQNRETAYKMLISKLTELKERELQETANGIKGELKKIEWGSQIRSYVFCPYTLVKDHRTGAENTNVSSVMDGDLENFIIEYLKKS